MGVPFPPTSSHLGKAILNHFSHEQSIFLYCANQLGKLFKSSDLSKQDQYRLREYCDIKSQVFLYRIRSYPFNNGNLFLKILQYKSLFVRLLNLTNTKQRFVFEGIYRGLVVTPNNIVMKLKKF